MVKSGWISWCVGIFRLAQRKWSQTLATWPYQLWFRKFGHQRQSNYTIYCSQTKAKHWRFPATLSVFDQGPTVWFWRFLHFAPWEMLILGVGFQHETNIEVSSQSSDNQLVGGNSGWKSKISMSPKLESEHLSQKVPSYHTGWLLETPLMDKRLYTSQPEIVNHCLWCHSFSGRMIFSFLNFSQIFWLLVPTNPFRYWNILLMVQWSGDHHLGCIKLGNSLGDIYHISWWSPNFFHHPINSNSKMISEVKDFSGLVASGSAWALLGLEADLKRSKRFWRHIWKLKKFRAPVFVEVFWIQAD